MLKTKIAGFANSVDLKEATQNDLPHLNLNGPQVFNFFFFFCFEGWMWDFLVLRIGCGIFWF